MDAEVASNTAGQAAERDRAMADVTAQRAGWRAEQDEELGKLGDKKTERHEKVRKDVQDKEKQTDDDVAKEKDDGDRKIRDENTRAERDAEKKRDDSVEDSGNWVTKAFDWIKKKVIEIKDAIVRVIKAARDAVVGFIKNFKETVERWIDAARKFVVDTIKQLVDDLVEFAKAMVRAIVELAARVRKFVTDLIAAAIALVNRLADALKQAVSDLLDAIGKLLSSILDFLKKMLQAAVKAVVDAVKAVLDFASKLLSALGDWMLIAVDFLSDPGGWLGGAKNSAVDGAKNHLFAEVSSAVKQWFREKIQEIIGVPKAVIDKLVRGGWTLDKIVKEAWDAVVPQLPLIIGELVLTKVVAKLIPGAGWVMAVIDAIRTAWGALSAILRALGMVLDWLKAVRGGGAGILFAKAVAAGVVALLEVLYQALLSGIGKYVSKVGRRLKDVAAKLGKPKPGKPKGPGAPDAPADGRPAKPEDRAPGKSATPDRPTDTKRPAPPKSPAPPKMPTDRPKPLSPPAPTRPKDSARPDRPQGADTPKPRTTDPSRPRDTGRPDRPGDRTPDRAPKRRDDTTPDRRSPDREDSGRRPRSKDDRGRNRHNDDRNRDPAEAKQRKRDEREKKEDSKESKDARLAKIAARIRPPVKGMLNRGVSDRSLKVALAAYRAWHRLSELSVTGTESFGIRARLNPETEILSGCAKIDRNDLLRFIHELGSELRTMTPQEQVQPPTMTSTVTRNAAGGRDVQREFLGASAGAVAWHMDNALDTSDGGTDADTTADRKRLEQVRMAGDRDDAAFLDASGESTTVNRALPSSARPSKRPVRNPRNFLISVMDPFTDAAIDPSYPQLKKWMARLETEDKKRFTRINTGLQAFLHDTSHTTGNTRDDAFVRGIGTWIILQEGRRNPAAMALQAMAMDLAASGKMDWSTAIDLMPMSAAYKFEHRRDAEGNLITTKSGKARRFVTQAGAVAESDKLKTLLYSKKPEEEIAATTRAQGNAIAEREIEVVRQWIRGLTISVDDPGSKEEVTRKIKQKIREEMERVYGR
ncbi:hypothetical protein [Streptomyces zhihengii]|uniref:hypothetical protein n=1 Tax=Streptomyces zhihengii TaxID=1818004 RepID=UPI0033ACE976